MAYLGAKINISGIPIILLVGEIREIINPKLGHSDKEKSKAELEKRIKE